MRVSRWQSAGAFLLFLAACLGTGFVGGLLTTPSIRSGWYASLTKPPFTPPAWIFGPVWTLLYLLMALSAWLVWSRWMDHPVRLPLFVFFTQLVFNLLWSAVFFGARKPGWALVEIMLLWVLILTTMILFRKISRVAALLLVPYVLWVFFATILNGCIWWMNREAPPLEGMIT